MPYDITFDLVIRSQGTTARTLTVETADGAWKLVRSLMTCDEKVVINGGALTRLELRALAEAK